MDRGGLRGAPRQEAPLIFVDSSAVVSFLAASEPDHGRCVEAFRSSPPAELVTTNYVVTELLAVLPRRLGMAQMRVFVDEVLQGVAVSWIDDEWHARGLATFLASSRSGASFVDHVSFAFMRRERITRAITLDRDFKAEGFQVVP